MIPNSRMRQVVESGQADLLDVIGVGDRQVVVSRIPLTDDNGEVTGALGVILYDRLQALRPIVSKFQQMQDDLARARRELGDSRRAKYRFSQFVGVSVAVLKSAWASNHSTRSGRRRSGRHTPRPRRTRARSP